MDKKIDAILSPSFVEEMMRLAFANRQFAIMVTDNLDLSNFPREMGGCKAMLKVLADNLRRDGGLATYGMVEMACPVCHRLCRISGGRYGLACFCSPEVLREADWLLDA